MSTNIIKELAGTVALLTSGSRSIVKALAADGADVASVCDKRRSQRCAAGAETVDTAIAKAVSER